VRLSFAQLVIAMAPGADPANPAAVSAALSGLGLQLGSPDRALQTAVAFCHFDTNLTNPVDPFDPQSPIKLSPIVHMPRDAIMVLRVIQMLRGLAAARGVKDYSLMKAWAPTARAALAEGSRKVQSAARQSHNAHPAELPVQQLVVHS
jgi:hypothetical protein